MEKENRTCPYCGRKLPNRAIAKKKYVYAGIGACLLLISAPFCNTAAGTIGNLIPSAILFYISYNGYKDMHFCSDCGEILKDDEKEEKSIPQIKE